LSAAAGFFITIMAFTRAQKQKVLEELEEKIDRQKALIFIDFTGLKVKDFSVLRKRMKAAGDEVKVVKKSLMDIAFKKAKLEAEPKKMPGEIALIFCYKNAILPAKTLYQFSKENEHLKILGGFFESEFREAQDFITLAQLPSKEELLAKLVGNLSAPIVNFVNVLQSNIKGLIYVLAKAKA
jgi:large subunit ribosomal protein L10